MSVIEFTTELHDSTIRIPEEHRGRIQGTVRVKITVQEEADQPDMIAYLLAHPLRIPDPTPLTRDEANERS